MRNLVALGLKWGLAFFTLAVWGQATGQLDGGAAVLIATAVAVLSWMADRVLPFSLQGVTRWAIDGGLAGLTIYAVQFLRPGSAISLLAALVIGFFLGAIELPLHTFLAARYGLRRPEDDKDGIR